MHSGKAPIWAGVIATVLASLIPPVASAQTPANRVRVIYGYPAGDSSDSVIRLLSEKMSKEMGRPFINENMAGASGRIGLKAVVNAPPDGGTLLYTPMAPVTLFPIAMPNLDYDPFKDLKPISQLVIFDIGLAAGAHIPVKTVAELVSWAKVNPDKASYGVPGTGGLPNFFAAMLSQAAGITIQRIPYRGTAPAIIDMVAGHLPMALAPSAQFTEMHKNGKLRIIATSGAQRSPFSPDVPTFRESGYDLVGEGWYALYAPANTPDGIVDRYSTVVQKILKEEETRQRILGWTFVPTGTTPQRLREIQLEDFRRWEPVIKASGFTPQ